MRSRMKEKREERDTGRRKGGEQDAGRRARGRKVKTGQLAPQNPKSPATNSLVNRARRLTSEPHKLPCPALVSEHKLHPASYDEQLVRERRCSVVVVVVVVTRGILAERRW